MWDSQAATSQPAYSKRKRLRRGLLRILGRWSRQNYDVRLIHENGRPTHKQVVFKSVDEARQVSAALRRYGATPHLPTWRGHRGNAVWVDFVEGATCRRVDEPMLPRLAECFAQFASRASYLESLDRTPYPRLLQDNLDYLTRQGVIGRRLRGELATRARRVAPDRVRLGFDYTDPIGANLVQRAGCGRICAIDIKNLRAHTLVGQGLAKAGDSWFSPARRPLVFEYLATRGLGDIGDSFSFLLLFGAIDRVRRKSARDIAVHRRVRAPRAKQARLDALLR